MSAQYNCTTDETSAEASRANPCPMCGGEKWCFHLNEDAVICGKTDQAPDGWVKTGEAKDGRAIFAKKGSYKRRHDEFPNPEEVLPLALDPKVDSPQWVTLSTIGTESEQQIEYFYPDAETGEPLGKVVRKQWSDRRAAYGRSQKDTKEIRPWHWQEPHHPDQSGKGWWSDRGKGSKPWYLYREQEVKEAITSGTTDVVFDLAGEQSVEVGREIGLIAFCNQGGEGSYLQNTVNFLSANKPKLVIIWPDNDETGKKLSVKKLKVYTKAGIKAIVIEPENIWLDIPEKGDIYDVVTKSGMENLEFIRRLEEEIHRAIEARHDSAQKPGSESDNSSQKLDTDLVSGKTVEAHILETLFESGIGKVRTIGDTFYADTGLGYWKRVADKPILKAIAHKLRSAYTLTKVEDRIVKKFPFFTDAKKKSTFSLCRDALDIGEIPANNHLRCFANCTVDVRTGEAISHDPAHFLTTAIASEYHPNQECPKVFLEFIKSAYGEDLVEVIRAYTSMLLDPTAPSGKFIHLMGPSGSGKGTILRFWGEMFGIDHFRSGEFGNLSTSEGRHQYLTGAALYCVPDVGGYVQGLKPFYELVDNGPMTGRALFSSNAYQKTWDCRYVVASVDHLQIENSGDGWDRRCLPLPTKARSGIEDPNLGSKLAEVKGQVVSWALAMPREERDRLILHPSTNERVLNLKHDAAIHGDPVRAFVDMCLRPSDNPETTLENHELHSWFEMFRQQHGYQSWGMSKFINHLKTIIPNHYVLRRRLTATEDPKRPMVPAHWKGIAELAGVFVNSACIKSNCFEGGLMALKNGSGGSGGSGTILKVPDPCKTTLNQPFQENGSGGSGRSGGGVVKYNAVCEKRLEVEKINEFNPISPTPVPDPPDPDFETLAGNKFNTDQAYKTEVADLPDPPDLPDLPDPLLAVADHCLELGDAESTASILIDLAEDIFNNPQMLDELVERWTPEFKRQVWKFIPSDLQRDYRALKKGRNSDRTPAN